MISPDEFLRRCERVKADFAAEARARQQLTCEAGGSVYPDRRAGREPLRLHSAQLTGLRVSDPGGNLVISDRSMRCWLNSSPCQPRTGTEDQAEARAAGP